MAGSRRPPLRLLTICRPGRISETLPSQHMRRRDSLSRSQFDASAHCLCGSRYTFGRVRSIVSMNPAGRVTLPADVRRALDLGDEAMFEVQVQKGAIVLKPVAVVPLDRARSYLQHSRRAQ